jgi:dipeptidase
MMTYSPTSAFWLFNQVANSCYQRYDSMSADALKIQKQLETGYIAETANIDRAAAALFEKSEKNVFYFFNVYNFIFISYHWSLFGQRSLYWLC